MAGLARSINGMVLPFVPAVHRFRVSIPSMSLTSELRSTARALAHRPGLSSAIVISLALSIWMATSVFSVAYGVLARPLPYPDADRIVKLENAPVVFLPTVFGISRIVRESQVLSDERCAVLS